MGKKPFLNRSMMWFLPVWIGSLLSSCFPEVVFIGLIIAILGFLVLLYPATTDKLSGLESGFMLGFGTLLSALCGLTLRAIINNIFEISH